MKKSGISELTLAHLNKALGTLLVQSKNPSEIARAINCFESGLKLYKNQGLKKGVALCKFGLAKIYCDRWND